MVLGIFLTVLVIVILLLPLLLPLLYILGKKYTIKKVRAQYEGTRERIISGGGGTSISISPNAYGSGYSGSVYRDSGWVDTVEYECFETEHGEITFKLEQAVYGGRPSCEDEYKYGILKYNDKHFSFKVAEDQEAARIEFEEIRKKMEEDKCKKDKAKPYRWIGYSILLAICSIFFSRREFANTELCNVVSIISLFVHPMIVWWRNTTLLGHWYEKNRKLVTILSAIDIIILCFLPYMFVGTSATVLHGVFGFISCCGLVIKVVIKRIRDKLWK